MRRLRQLTSSYWPADQSLELLEGTLGDLLRQRAGEAAGRLALVEGTPDPAERRRWTYRELLHSSETVARALLQRFSPGERIAVWSPNSAEWVLLQHGVSMAGMVLVTVNPAYLSDELEYVLSTSGASGIFFTDRYRHTNMAAIIEAMRPRLPNLREAVSFSSWAEFIATSDPTVELPAVTPGDMIQIQFTSGTTGKPKGACLHHRGIINAARFAAMRAGFPPGGVWVSAMPLFHVGGCAGSEIGAFSAGGTFVMQPAFDAGAMLELLESECAAQLHAVPTMLVALLDHPDFPRRNLALKTIMSGGSPVPAALVARAKAAFGCKFTISFGQTELNGVISQTFPDDSPDLQSTTIGRPAPQMEVKIADPATGKVCPLGEPGEIWARGYQTMLGYFNVPEGSEAALTDEGWLKTGDQATMDAAGYLRIAGRLKDSIIRGGENIYPREIEDVLHEHSAVLAASVVGVPDGKWGEIVAAVIQLRAGEGQPIAAELHAYCRAKLAAYKTPALWFFVAAYPTTSSGKVQKYALREMIRTGELKPVDFVPPTSRRPGARAVRRGCHAPPQAGVDSAAISTLPQE